MQKGLTPVNSSEKDCCADDAVEEAEETGIPMSSVSIGVRPLCNLRFTDDIDLLGSSEEELQQLIQRLAKKLRLNTAWKSAPTRKKIIVNSIKLRLSTNIQMK